MVVYQADGDCLQKDLFSHIPADSLLSSLGNMLKDKHQHIEWDWSGWGQV